MKGAYQNASSPTYENSVQLIRDDKPYNEFNDVGTYDLLTNKGETI